MTDASWRLTIGRVMAAVGVVAANLAVARTIALGGSPELLAGCLLPGIALEVAAWRAWRGRGRGRAVALGFLLVGALALASLVWAMLRPASMGISAKGAVVTTPGSIAWRVWEVYFRAVERALGPLLGAIPQSIVLQLAVTVVILGAPTLLAGLIGGLMGALAWRVGRRSRPIDSSPGGPPADDSGGA
jgi:hypothetical protein